VTSEELKGAGGFAYGTEKF